MGKVNCVCENCKKEFEVKWASRKRRFCSKSCSATGENNPSWKGDNVGIQQVHTWVEKQLGRPDKCSKCNTEGKVDLANISQEYKRDLTDWEWLCRKCHMDSDGRMEEFLSHSNKNNKLPDVKCPICELFFSPGRRNAKHCSTECYTKSKIGNPCARKGKKYPGTRPDRKNAARSKNGKYAG